jgi:hypothetical protein
VIISLFFIVISHEGFAMDLYGIAPILSAWTLQAANALKTSAKEYKAVKDYRRCEFKKSELGKQ